MHAQFSHNRKTIFIKTAKGREEIAQRCHNLNPRHRRALILIDGVKNLDMIAAMATAIIPSTELAEAVSMLTHHGFITAAQNDALIAPVALIAPIAPIAPTTQIESAKPDNIIQTIENLPNSAPTADTVLTRHVLVAPVRSAAPALTQDPDTIRLIKDFMTTTAHTYLGLLSADIIHRIERTRDAAQLMTVVGQWHMALRDSKQGARFAGSYLEKVKHALTTSESISILE